MFVELNHTKFQEFSAQETISNWGLNGNGGRKFNEKLTISWKR